MKIVDFLRPELVVEHLTADNKTGVLAELSAYLAARQPGLNAADLRRVLEEREALASTAIGDGIAIPHGKLDAVGQLVGCLGRSIPGIPFESVDGKPTHLV